MHALLSHFLAELFLTERGSSTEQLTQVSWGAILCFYQYFRLRLRPVDLIVRRVKRNTWKYIFSKVRFFLFQSIVGSHLCFYQCFRLRLIRPVD